MKQGICGRMPSFTGSCMARCGVRGRQTHMPPKLIVGRGQGRRPSRRLDSGRERPSVAQYILYCRYVTGLRPDGESFPSRIQQISHKELCMSSIARQAKGKQLRSVTLRIPRDIIQKLKQYSQFIESSQSYIVTESLRLTFNDSEFEAWCKHHPLPKSELQKVKTFSFITSDLQGRATAKTTLTSTQKIPHAIIEWQPHLPLDSGTASKLTSDSSSNPVRVYEDKETS